jgi:hypothetical protein
MIENRGQMTVNSEVGMRNERAEIGMRKAESKAASIEQGAEDGGRWTEDRGGMTAGI